MSNQSPFTPIADTPSSSRYLTCAVWGQTKTRRTSFAMSAPQPIYYFYSDCENADEGTRYARDRDIRKYKFLLTPPPDLGALDTVAWAMENKILESFEHAFAYAVSRLTGPEKGGTMVWDLGRHVRDMLVMCNFGSYTMDKMRIECKERKLKFNPRIDAGWGPIEHTWQRWINASRAHDSYNMVFVEIAKDQYVDNAPTGRMVMSGGKNIHTVCQATVKCEREDILVPNANGTATIPQSKYYRTISDPAEWAEKSHRMDADVLTFPIVASWVLGRDVSEFQ